MEGSNSTEKGPKAKASGRAIASLVLGIASLIIIPIVGFITGALGVIFGGLELKAIKKGRSSSKGKGFAITGLITGIVGLVVQFMIIAVPNYLNLSKRGVSDNTVKSVAHAVQLAVEDYRTSPGHEGIKPTSVSEIDSFLTTSFGDRRNPFKENQTYSPSGGGLVDGYPTQPGQVGYVFTDQRVPYRIIALGKYGKPVLTLEEGH